MQEYHKIQTVFKRDPETKFKTLLIGDFALPEFEYLKNNLWVYTEKVDGTNIRVLWNGEIVRFGGKTDNASIPSFLLQKLQDRFLGTNNIKLFLEKFGEDGDVCLYGEGYGAKIQKGGGNYRADQNFVLFDVKIGDWWLRREDVTDVAKFFDIEIVPVIGEGNLLDMVSIARTGFNSQWGNFLAEGIVARPQVELRTRSNQRVITKIKYKDF